MVSLTIAGSVVVSTAPPLLECSLERCLGVVAMKCRLFHVYIVGPRRCGTLGDALIVVRRPAGE
jgi:hypothetical protein